MLQQDKRNRQVAVLCAMIKNAGMTSGDRQEQIIRDAIDKCCELTAGLQSDLDNVRKVHK